MGNGLETAMRGIAARLGASPERKIREENHVRRFPRILAWCGACGKTHTFARTARGALGYGCGAKLGVLPRR